jgi:hypothetical protein
VRVESERNCENVRLARFVLVVRFVRLRRELDRVVTENAREDGGYKMQGLGF